MIKTRLLPKIRVSDLSRTHLRFFFFTSDSPFFWDRASTLSGVSAERAGVSFKASFRSGRIPADAVLCFNRFSRGGAFSLAACLARQLGVPYLVDIDDLYWDLPGFSNDSAASSEKYRKWLDSLTLGARAITTTNERLKGKLQERFPGKDVFIIDNCPPAWYAPKPAILIANTDSFKMEGEEVRWLARILEAACEKGFSVQLVGENRNLVEAAGDFLFSVLPEKPLDEYLNLLSSGRFCLGLVPVARSAYADCKSAIKLMEMSAAGLQVIASDIAPYREFLNRFPGLPVRLVENTPEAWAEAVRSCLEKFSFSNLKETRAINEMLLQSRKRQLSQWLEVGKQLGREGSSRLGITIINLALAAMAVLRRPIGFAASVVRAASRVLSVLFGR